MFSLMTSEPRRVDERLADAVEDARPLLLRLEEALWSGVGGDGARGLVVLAHVVRKADEAHGRVVALDRVADLVEEADAEDGGQRTSLDDPAGGLGVVGVVVVGALEAEWVPIGGGEVQVVAVPAEGSRKAPSALTRRMKLGVPMMRRATGRRSGRRLRIQSRSLTRPQPLGSGLLSAVSAWAIVL